MCAECSVGGCCMLTMCHLSRKETGARSHMEVEGEKSKRNPPGRWRDGKEGQGYKVFHSRTEALQGSTVRITSRIVEGAVIDSTLWLRHRIYVGVCDSFLGRFYTYALCLSEQHVPDIRLDAASDGTILCPDTAPLLPSACPPTLDPLQLSPPEVLHRFYDHSHRERKVRHLYVFPLLLFVTPEVANAFTNGHLVFYVQTIPSHYTAISVIASNTGRG